VGNFLKLTGFTGSYTPLNGQLIQLTTQTGTQIVAPVTGVPDGSTGAGYQFCAYNMAGLLTASPYLPSSSSVVNISIPGEQLANVVANYNTLIHPWAPSVTGKPAIIVLHAGDGEVDNCTALSTIQSLYTTLWQDLATDSIQVAQTGVLPDNGTAGCSTAQKSNLANNTNIWLKAQTPAGISQNGSGSVIPSYNYFVDEYPLMPDSNNPFYYINPTGQSHLTDQGNFHYYYAVQDALLFTGEIPQTEGCDGGNGFICQNGVPTPAQSDGNVYNFFANNENGTLSQSNGNIYQYFKFDPNGFFVNWADNLGTDYPTQWYGASGPNTLDNEPYNMYRCWAPNISIPTAAVNVCASSDTSVANQYDIGCGGGTFPCQVGTPTNGGLGTRYWYPDLATAPTLSSSCSGTPIGYYPSRDQIMSYCNGSVWSRPFSSSSFTAGGDLSGTSTSQEVVGIHSVPLCSGFTPTTGQILAYTTSSSPNPCWTAQNAPSGSFSAGGDLTGSSSSQQVVGINSVPLCSGFTPTAGQNLQYTTSSSPNPCWTAAAGGGGSGALTQIGQFILGSPTTSITFSSIPGSYTNLRLVMNVGTDDVSFDRISVQFNTDTTTSDYAYSQIFQSNTTVGAGNGANNTLGNVTPGGSSYPSTYDCSITSYSGTTFYKTILCNESSYQTPIQQIIQVVYWTQTSAINQIVLKLLSGDHFTVGSTFTLYGMQ
jgi:hypothetical protein